MKKILLLPCFAFSLLLLLASCQSASGSGDSKAQVGVTWTQRNLPAEAYWSAVAYGGGKFAAVSKRATASSSSSSIAAVSDNGASWTKVNMPGSAPWVSLAYGSAGFAAIAWGGGDSTQGGGTCFSADGSSWKGVIPPDSGGNLAYWTDIAFDGEDYWAATYAFSTTARLASTSNGSGWTPFYKDGMSFTSVVGGDPAKLEFLVFGTTSYYSCTYGTLIPLSSSPPIGLYPHKVAYGDGRVVAIYNTKAASTSLIEAYNAAEAYFKAGAAQTPFVVQFLSSVDLTWTKVTLPLSASCITYGDGTFVALGGAEAATSTDGGLTWTTHDLPVSANWSSAAYGNGTVVAVAYQDSNNAPTSVIVTSP